MAERMSVADIEKRLYWWSCRHKELTKQAEALRAVTGGDYDAPLMAAVWAVWNAYTVAVGELVGDSDEWLQWYETECSMGRTPKMAYRAFGSDGVNVRTIKQLARVIHMTAPHPHETSNQ